MNAKEQYRKAYQYIRLIPTLQALKSESTYPYWFDCDARDVCSETWCHCLREEISANTANDYARRAYEEIAAALPDQKFITLARITRRDAGEYAPGSLFTRAFNQRGFCYPSQNDLYVYDMSYQESLYRRRYTWRPYQYKKSNPERNPGFAEDRKNAILHTQVDIATHYLTIRDHWARRSFAMRHWNTPAPDEIASSGIGMLQFYSWELPPDDPDYEHGFSTHSDEPDFNALERAEHARIDAIEDQREVDQYIRDHGYHPDEHYPGRDNAAAADDEQADTRPLCPVCIAALDRFGVLPSYCGFCGTDRTGGEIE